VTRVPPGYLAWLQGQVRTSAPPPDDFEPHKATDAELARLGLPARPDARTAPRLRALWEEMMRPPLRFVVPTLRPAAGSDGPGPGAPPCRDGTAASVLGPRHRRATPASPRATRSGVSQNWSGAVLAPSRGRRFGRVLGLWRAPLVSPGDGPDGGLDWKCSVWIGLDGDRLWHLGMPQIGTEHVVDGKGRQEVRVWWQWWLREGFSCPVLIEGFPVKPGDNVIFDLTRLDERTVLFAGCNLAAGRCMVPIRVPLPPVLPWPEVPDGMERDPTGLPPTVPGASAEWIVERPRDLPPPFGTDAFHPLPDFGAVAFDGAALMEEAGGEPEAEVTIDSPRLLRLVERLDGPSRAVTRVRPAMASPDARPGPAQHGIRVEYLPARP
jgi:Peptidase A4 family